MACTLATPKWPLRPQGALQDRSNEVTVSSDDLAYLDPSQIAKITLNAHDRYEFLIIVDSGLQVYSKAILTILA